MKNKTDLQYLDAVREEMAALAHERFALRSKFSNNPTLFKFLHREFSHIVDSYRTFYRQNIFVLPLP